MRNSIAVSFALLALAGLLNPGFASASELSVLKYQAISIPIPYSQQGVANVWDDVTITAVLSAPDGSSVTIGGFYHSTNLWMIRYAPSQVGEWQYTATIKHGAATSTVQGSFTCLKSNEPGFIRLNTINAGHRWQYAETGKLYTGLGFGDCMYAARDSILEYGYIDGGFRTAGIDNTNGWVLPYAQYLTAYGDVGGFNLYRYSDGNCAYSMVRTISASGNNFDTLHSRWTDTLFYALRQHGFRIYMTILASPVGSSSDAKSMAAVERYAQFCIDRYGPLVDFWELTNESTPDSLWISEVAGYIHTHDPYHHAVSMSWEQPNHPAIDIISPHWYGREDVRTSDQTTADQIAKYAGVNKPVIFGEQGEGATWDSLSAIRMRGRIWSAMMNAATLIFWNTSFAKDCPCNEYLGWEERRYAHVLENFAKALKPNQVTSAKMTNGNCNIWRMLSLGNDQMACYIRNDKDINAINTNISVQLAGNAIGGEADWYDVHTGDILQRIPITPSLTSVTAPPFKTDIALLVGLKADSLLVDSNFRLNVTPRTMSVVSAPVNGAATRSIGLKNTGTDIITITRALFSNDPSNNFTLSGPSFPFIIAAGDSETLTIRYAPKDTGVQITMLSLVQLNSLAWENIAITAVAVAKSGVEPSTSLSKEIKLSPDPARDFLTVAWKGSHPLVAYEIYSVTGALALAGNAMKGEKIDVRRLIDGEYSVILHEEGKLIGSEKLMIVR